MIEISNLDSKKIVSFCQSILNGETYSIAKGVYSIDKEDCIEKELYISNSLPISLNVNQRKRVMFYLKNKHDVTIDGNGSSFLANGKEIYIVMQNCSNITFKNITFNYTRPTITEMLVKSIGKYYIDYVFDEQSQYKIEDNKISLTGPDGDYIGDLKYGLTQEHDVESNITYRMKDKLFWCFNIFKNITKAERKEDNIVRIYYSKMPQVKIGNYYQFRNVLRDGAGFFIDRSNCVILENINVNYMHGLGVVCQCSSNIKVLNCNFVPVKTRTAAGFADMIHCVGCAGYIDIENCVFDGAHDDALNVHGVHQRIVKYISKRKILVMFSHPDSFGYDYYDKLDKLQFIDAYSLLPYFDCNVVNATRINLTDTIIEIDKEIPFRFRMIHLNSVVENLSKNCSDLKYCNNKLYNIPTRGVLVTTSGKVEIENNLFYKTQMSGILISDDAKSWYESGRVKDVTIKNNNFVECGSPTVYIHPENAIHLGTVHKNIKIIENTFTSSQQVSIDAKSTKDLTILNNKFDDGSILAREHIKLKNCKNVRIN